MKILFLDLDGTVRRTKSGATFINDPYDQELIPGVEEAIACYQEWKIIGVTNQGGVGAGYKSLESCILEQRQTINLLPQMSLLLFCTDNGETMYRIVVQSGASNKIPALCKSTSFGNFRKPGPGMVNFGLNYFGEKPKQVLMVGDRPEDQQCAANASIPFMRAEEWRNQK